MRPVDLDELARARPAVEHVDVLGDDRVEVAAALELDQRAVGAVGLLALERLEAVAVEVPEALGVRAPGVDVGHRHRVDVLPQPGARASGSRGSRRAPRCPRRSAPRPSRPRARGRPASRRGCLPPAPRRLALAEEGADALAGVLAGEDGARRRPSRPRCRRRGRRRRRDLLDRADGQRRLPGELARPLPARCRASSWSRTTRLTRPKT